MVQVAATHRQSWKHAMFSSLLLITSAAARLVAQMFLLATNLVASHGHLPSTTHTAVGSPSASRGKLVREYDDIFRSECRPIPVAYLRALAKHESSFNATNAQGAAWGLLQVTEVVRRDYNRRRGTSIARTQLLDARVNARIACYFLAHIATRFGALHGRAFPRPDWRDSRFAALVTYAWNAGYSEAAGVGYVVKILERQGVPPPNITLESVHLAAAELPRASRHLRNSAKVIWCKKVLQSYMRNLGQR